MLYVYRYCLVYRTFSMGEPGLNCVLYIYTNCKHDSVYVYATKP